MNAGKTRALTVALVLGIAAGAVYSETPPPGAAPKPPLFRGLADLGLIFSTDNPLNGVQSYEGGIGAKIGWGAFALRGSLDLVANGSSGSFLLDTGVTGEYHLAPGPVSPYVGAAFHVGYTLQSGVMSTIPVSLGAIAGVEVFILDFLSIFAEYSLTLTVTATNDLQASQTTIDYLLNTGLGNGSKIGIVVYLDRIGAKK